MARPMQVNLQFLGKWLHIYIIKYICFKPLFHGFISALAVIGSWYIAGVFSTCLNMSAKWINVIFNSTLLIDLNMNSMIKHAVKCECVSVVSAELNLWTNRECGNRGFTLNTRDGKWNWSVFTYFFILLCSFFIQKSGS